MNKKAKGGFPWGILVIFVILAALLLFLFAVNHWYIKVTPNGDNKVHIEYQSGQEYTEKGAEAFVTGTILSGIKLSRPVSITGTVDTDTPGTYQISYNSDLLWMHGSAYRTVTVSDTTPPEITLTTDPDAYTLPHHAYKEEGYKAVDNIDGDLTDKVHSDEKDGVVYYTVKDKAGNEGRAERTIVYDDRNAPVITLEGGEKVSLTVGDTWEDSYTAEDDADGDVTDKVKVEGEVDTSKEGTYTLTYTVSDEWGNEAKATRKVKVSKKKISQEQQVLENGGRVIYLTFDDGPGPYTQQLLDVFAKHENAKATFFVTNQFPEYQDLIAKEAEAGHAVAVHTYSHDYAQVYSSAEAYWEDFDRMNDIIEEKTGRRTNLFRFPGGSSNTISSGYVQGLMTTLAAQADEKGLVYFDWNVDSNDAGGTTTADGIYENITNGCSGMDVSVVLCHDIKPYTVEAMDRVLQWGEENGYTFLPMTEQSSTAHHGINN